jgi:dihydroneopterin aldolase
VSDRIALTNMIFQGKHGLTDEERAEPQPFEIDVELVLDLGPAGRTDDLTHTVDYREVFEICRAVVEGTSRHLIESLAETIASRILALEPAPFEVTVRVRKPAVPLPGRLDNAAVEVVRRRNEA